MPRRVKTEVFADLGDPVLFPRLSEAKIERLAGRGERRVYETDELLFDQGQRDAPFFLIEDGTVDIIDRRPNEEQPQRFDAVLSSFHRAVELVDGPDGMVRVDLDDGQHVVTRTLLVATGAQWRTLDVDGIDRFTGAACTTSRWPPTPSVARARTSS